MIKEIIQDVRESRISYSEGLKRIEKTLDLPNVNLTNSDIINIMDKIHDEMGHLDSRDLEDIQSILCEYIRQPNIEWSKFSDKVTQYVIEEWVRYGDGSRALVKQTEINRYPSIEPHDIYYYKGNQYVVVSLVKDKINGEWIERVLYQSTNDGSMYVNDVSEFLSKFVKK